MAGIRGAKNPFPPKAAAGPSGVFNQQGSGGPFMHGDVKSAAMKSDRKGPVGRNNKLPSNKGGHYTNGGLKKGTAS